ncbi:DUF1398 family protein [Phyllobacterium zundukense]
MHIRNLATEPAAAGVCTWIMDAVEMTCTFYSKSGEQLLVDDL